jgi:hypothetical protein
VHELLGPGDVAGSATGAAPARGPLSSWWRSLAQGPGDVAGSAVSAAPARGPLSSWWHSPARHLAAQEARPVWLLVRGGIDSWRRSSVRHLATRSAHGLCAPLELAPRLVPPPPCDPAVC